MKLLVLKYWNRLRSSFWFVPALMAATAAILALVGVFVDQPLTDWLASTLGWEFSGGAEGASAVLGVIAGSMINIAGVVFSMTLVALSLTSSQLGPRLLRSFMRDTTTQVVLGTFVATFVYCLLVLRTIRRAEDVAFVPHLSVGLGVGLAVAGVGVLIYFIHHVSVSIQANEIAARIGHELLARVDGIYPNQNEENVPLIFSIPPDPSVIEAFEQDTEPLAAERDGYLQLVDKEGLINLAAEEDVIFRLERRPGNYIIAGCPLVSISPANKASENITARVQSMFVMGNQRTSDEDIEFAVNQLVEMAVRALSPGINDPFTAIACIDHLGSALCRLATRDMPSPYHFRDDKLRLIGQPQTFGEVADAAFNQIRQYGRSSVSVTIRLLDTIAVVASFVHRPEDRASLSRHAAMILRGAEEGLPETEDLQLVKDRWLDKKPSHFEPN